MIRVAEAEDSDLRRGGDGVSGDNVEEKEALEAWKWRQQQWDGCLLSCWSGSGSRRLCRGVISPVSALNWLHQVPNGGH